jgi:hypothetical protein
MNIIGCAALPPLMGPLAPRAWYMYLPVCEEVGSQVRMVRWNSGEEELWLWQ